MLVSLCDTTDSRSRGTGARGISRRWSAVRRRRSGLLSLAACQASSDAEPASDHTALLAELEERACWAALRRVLLEARRLGLMSPDDYAHATDIAAVKGSSLPPGRALSMGELSALMIACSADRSAAGPRDAALIALLSRGGLRRSEVVALDLSDYVPETGAITVRSGKGRKDRTTYLDGGAAVALADWLAMRGAVAGPLLCPVNKAGTITIRRLSDQAVLGALQKRAKQATVKGFSPHDLRRTFISDLLDAGADIATVQRMAGHASPETTSRYDRRGEATKRRAASLLHLAYESRTGGAE
jgi:integrase/recombinase XerD